MKKSFLLIAFILSISTNFIPVAQADITCTDGDNDGFALEGGDCGPIDCDDNNPAARPGIPEVCGDGVDNNCDGYADGTDPTVSPDFCCADADGDGFSGTNQPYCGPLDCNDNNPTVRPGIPEVCGDGIDNNCDGYADGTDPTVSPDFCCADADGDGFSGTNQPYCGPLDCNDNNPTVRPGIPEVCGDGIDNNCDGYADGTDPTVSPDFCCADADGDGFSGTNQPYCGPLDCNDNNPTVRPGIPEVCGDGIDNNCDGYADGTDPTVSPDFCCADADGDGFSGTNQPYCGPLDCNDNNPTVRPGIPEVCGDGIDNNCDGYADGTDPTVSPDFCCADADGDGFSGTNQPYCGPLDCNDNNPTVRPGIPEVCGDGVDNNCDGYADGTDPTVSPDFCCADVDGDGFSGTNQPYCGPLDCNDNNPTVRPGIPEVCGDGVDNNCDGLIDDSDPVCAAPCSDTDIDGFYAEGPVCGTLADCNDSDLFVNPAATEVCNDTKDNNCDGFVDCLDASCVNDPACVICTDSDGDGYAVEGGSCGPIDCNDNNLAVNPGAVETCTGGLDNDCDNLIDCVDADCSGNIACGSVCIPEASKELGEKCQDRLDNDCDGVIDCSDLDCRKERACK